MLALPEAPLGESQTARRLLVACAVVGLTVSACNRTALVPLSFDGGAADSARDLATDPASETVREDVAVDAGREHGRELGPEAGSDVPLDLPGERRPEIGREAGTEVRETGPELRRESGIEVGREVGPEIRGEVRWEVGPESGDSRDVMAETRDARPGCTWPTTTSTLAELEWLADTETLAVRGDRVFVGISQPATATSPPVSAIVGISVVTGNAQTFPLGNVLPTRLTAGSDSLFYLQGRPTSMGGGSWRFDYPDVARLDTATGQTSVVDSEIVRLGYSILSLAATPRGEVFWSMLASSRDSSAVLKRWDQTTQATVTVQTVEQPADLVADDDHLYWSGFNAAGRMAFFSASTTGGEVTQIQEWSSDLTDTRLLRAVDDQSLYFIRPEGSTKGIFAMPKQGGDSRAVAADVDPVGFDSQTVDDTHVYWIEASDQANIRRTLKTGGGAIEKIPGATTGDVFDVAVDRCNIYWLPSGTPRLLVRGK